MRARRAAHNIARHPIRFSERARVYRDPAERKASLYVRWMAWWGWRGGDVVRVAAALGGLVLFALLNADSVVSLESPMELAGFGMPGGSEGGYELWSE